MQCSKCHKIVSDESQFCEYCGAQITGLPKETNLSTSEKSDETAIKLGVLSRTNKEVIIFNRQLFIDGQKVDAKKILEYDSLGIIEWEDGDKSKAIASFIINDESRRNNYESESYQNSSYKTLTASMRPSILEKLFSTYLPVMWLSLVGIVLLSLVSTCSGQNNGKLIGRWTDISDGATIIFSSDNTYVYSYPEPGWFLWSGEDGTYRVNGGTVTLIPDVNQDEERVFNFKVQNDMLSLETDEGGLSMPISGDYSK